MRGTVTTEAIYKINVMDCHSPKGLRNDSKSLGCHESAFAVSHNDKKS
ncbi:hypothetical protein [uncultured Helicobacter sp.]|nr:hypothetical protein [uncultured Helicobacter sp.]